MIHILIHYSAHQIKTNKMSGTFGGQEMRVQGVRGKHESKSPLGKPRGRWEDNIKMDIQDVIWVA
jgi:hypothetical protein